MRAFIQAAALLLVHSVVGESVPEGVRRVSATETIPAAYVEVNVPLKNAGTEVVPLRLDVVESDDACSPAKLSINGQRLAQDAEGYGEGALTLENSNNITARWTFTCERAIKQILLVEVISVNGEPVAADTSFTANFYQTTPVQIASVERVAAARYLHRHTTVTEAVAESGSEHVEVAVGNQLTLLNKEPSVEAEMSSLEELRAQARELAALIKDKENALLGKLSQDSGEDDESEDDSAVPLEECRDVRCAFKVVVDNIRHGHEELCEGARGWRAYFGCGSGLDVTEEFIMEDEDDMEWLDDEEWDAEDFYFTEEDMTRYPQSSRISMLMLVAETAFIFGAAVFCITAILRRLTRRAPPPNQLPRYQDGRYFDEPKTLISFRYVDDLETGRSGTQPAADVKTTYSDEKMVLREAETAQEGVDGNSSVADEISQLREAVGMVSDMVAVDAAERRTGAEHDDEAPPAYSEDAGKGCNCRS